MNRRTSKSVIYRCDKIGCKAQHVAPFRDYKLAAASAKAAGWVTVKIHDRWLHFCSWVHRPPTAWQMQEVLDDLGRDRP